MGEINFALKINLFYITTTVPFLPSGHNLGIFGLQEGRKIIFQLRWILKRSVFFGCDAWLNTWSKWYIKASSHLNKV